MNTPKSLKITPLRIALAGLVAGTLLVPTAVSAAPGSSGTLVGTVTCGAAEETHAGNFPHRAPHVRLGARDSA